MLVPASHDAPHRQLTLGLDRDKCCFVARRRQIETTGTTNRNERRSCKVLPAPSAPDSDLSGAPVPAPVLYVHHRSELGGAPASLAQLIERLDRERYRPTSTARLGRRPALPGGRRHRDHGAVSWFTHIWASTYHGRRWLLLARELARLPGAPRRARRVLDAERFALVHLNDSPLSRRRGSRAARRPGRLAPALLAAALPEHEVATRPRCDPALCPRLDRDQRRRRRLVRTGADTIPNGVDLDRFAPGPAASAREALGLEPGLPVVAYVGFLYPHKGFREFLGAAALTGGARFLIVGGDGPCEAFFRGPAGRLLARFGLAHDYGREAGSSSRSSGSPTGSRSSPYTLELPAVYRASTIVVAPSQGPESAGPTRGGCLRPARRRVRLADRRRHRRPRRDGPLGRAGHARALAACDRTAARRRAAGRAPRRRGAASRRDGLRAGRRNPADRGGLHELSTATDLRERRLGRAYDPAVTAILGLNAYHGDAAAALVVDGVLVAAAEEERFNRVKHCAGFPALAARWCLEDAGVDPASSTTSRSAAIRARTWAQSCAGSPRRPPSLGYVRSRAQERLPRSAAASEYGARGGARRPGRRPRAPGSMRSSTIAPTWRAPSSSRPSTRRRSSRWTASATSPRR